MTSDSPPDPAGPRAEGDLSRHLARGVLSLWAREGKWAEIPLAGSSMLPLIPDGSVLTVRFGRSGLSTGDIVLYLTDEHLVAHRVLRLGRGGRRWGHLKVKGDPVRYGETTWIPVEDVVGRVIAARRPDGSAILLNGSAGRIANRVAASIGSLAAPVEGRILTLLGRRRGPLRAVPAFLNSLDPVYRLGGRTGRREAGLLLGAEERFLIIAARVRLGAADEQRLIRVLGGELPWERIVAAASGLGLAPLLYRNLGRGALRSLVPARAMTLLARGAHAAACRTAIQMESLGQILEALGRKGIEPVLLKGAALALTLYDQPALRPMQDLDLLVPAGDVSRAVEVVQSLGFSGIRGTLSDEFYEGHHHARPMIRPGDQVIVEIHRGLVPPEDGLLIEAGPLIERAVRAVALDRPLRVLCREDQVLHLALHLSYADRFMGRLRDLLDLHAIMEAPAPGIEWGRILDAATRHEVGRSLFSTMDLARRLLGTEIPRGVTGELARAARWDPLASHMLRALARSSLFRGGTTEAILSPPAARWLCDALIKRARWGGRLLDLIRVLGSPEHSAI